MSDRNDEFRRQLGTIWRIAQDGVGSLRELASWSTQAGRLRIDLALLQRERDGLYQQLGQEVAVLIGEGSLQVPRPVRETYERIREIDVRMRSGSVRLHDNAFGAPRGYEPEAADDYDYGMTEGVDGQDEGVVKEEPRNRKAQKPAQQSTAAPAARPAKATPKTRAEKPAAGRSDKEKKRKKPTKL